MDKRGEDQREERIWEDISRGDEGERRGEIREPSQERRQKREERRERQEGDP